MRGSAIGMGEVMCSDFLRKLLLTKRTVSKARAVWFNTMDTMAYVRDLFDIKWFDTSLKVSVKGFLVGQRITTILLAAHSQGAKWWIGR